jgi:hypothetical protein
VLLRGIEIESLMQVDPNPETSLVDVEEAAEPRAEEANHRGIGVGEPHLAVRLRAFTRVQHNASGREGVVTEPSDALGALRVEPFDV